MRAGIQVAESASQQVKRVHLELGGRAPVVVFDDADIDAAVEGIAIAGCFNAGQDCTAATRVMVAQGVHDDFVAALAAYARDNAPVGMPDDPDALFGPVNNAHQLARVTGFLDRLPAHATVSAGGNRITAPGDGYFLEPTVVSGLRQEDEAIQNEIFGPVITVQRFVDEDEAVAWPMVSTTASLPVWDLEGPRPRDADEQTARLRLRLDQHPHPARRRDAARRVQALGLRQGSVDDGFEDYTRIQARHGQYRELGTTFVPISHMPPADPGVRAWIRSAQASAVSRRPVVLVRSRPGGRVVGCIPPKPPAEVWRR